LASTAAAVLRVKELRKIRGI